MKTRTALATAGIVATLGSVYIAGRIFYGSPANQAWHEAVGGFHRKGSRAISCSGTLYRADRFATAAHCCDGMVAEGLQVSFGKNPVTDRDAGFYDVAELHQHPGYNRSTLEGDVCWLRLVTAPGIEPIPILRSAPKVGELVNFAGYGQTEHGTYNQRLQVDGRISSLTAGKMQYAQRPPPPDGGMGGGPCFGDSGGPAFVFRDGKPFLAGITSSGDENCTAWGDSTRADAYAEWLDPGGAPDAGTVGQAGCGF